MPQRKAPGGLFGRDHDERRLRALIAEGPRIVTITGPAGVGKSALARQLLESDQDPFRGVAIDFANAETPEDILAVAAQHLDISAGGVGDRDEAFARLSRAVALRGELLLVIDNVEHLMAEVLPELVAPFLARAQESRLVFTARAPTGLPGERVFNLEPLDDKAAAALFLERASGLRPDHPLNPKDPALPRLLERLSNLPLAIELAASRAEVLSVAQIEERLQRSLRLLQTKNPRSSARHRSLRATIEQSFETLRPDEERALLLCALHQGDVDPARFAHMLENPDAAGPMLATLWRKSMLVRAGDDGVYRVLHPVRAFARDRLAERDDAAALRARHARGFAQLAAELDGQTQAQLETAQSRRDDFVAAVRELLEVSPDEAGTLLLRLQAVFERTLLAPTHLGLYDAVLAKVPAGPLHARLWHGRGRVLILIGRYAEAQADAERAVAAAVPDEDPVTAGRAHSLRGAARCYQGDRDGAQQDLDRAGALLEGRDPEGYSRNVLRQCTMAMFAGDVSTCLDLANRSIALTQAAHNHVDHALALIQRALIHAMQGELDPARAGLAAALPLAEVYTPDVMQGLALYNLAWIEFERRDYAEAERYAQILTELCRKAALSRYQSLLAALSGLIDAERGDLDRAQASLQRAEDLRSPDDRSATLMTPRAFRTVVLASARKFTEARALVEELDGETQNLDTGPATATATLVAAARLLLAIHDKDAGLITATVAHARQLLTIPPPALGQVRVARRWLIHVLAHRENPRGLTIDDTGRPKLIIGRDCTWFEHDGIVATIRNRRASRNILSALVATHRAMPGYPLSVHDVFEAGWPGQSISHDAAKRRVYTAVSDLRSLGLDELLVTGDDGYLLDPRVVIEGLDSSHPPGIPAAAEPPPKKKGRGRR